jgi:hypothetical protein
MRTPRPKCSRAWVTSEGSGEGAGAGADEDEDEDEDAGWAEAGSE